MIDILEPIFKGPLAPFGKGLNYNTVQPPGTVSLSDLVYTSDTIETLLDRQAQILGTADLRPVASLWMMNYTALLLPPAIAATTLLLQVLPMTPREVTVDLDGNGNPRTVFIPHQGHSASGQDSAYRYASLIDTHLAPLISRLSEASRLPTKILWGNIARRVDAILDIASTMSETLTTAIRTDRKYLLQHQYWSKGRRNPLYGRQKTALQKLTDGRQIRVQLHRQCCLYYLLPGEDYCGACPLSPRCRDVEL